MGGTSTIPTTSEETQIPPWLEQQYRQVSGDASRLYRRGVGYNPYPGATHVPMNQTQTRAADQILRLASDPAVADAAVGAGRTAMNRGGMTDDLNEVLGYMRPTARGSMLNKDPYIDRIVSDMARDVEEPLALRYGGMGRFGSPEYHEDVAQEVGSLSTQLRNQAYQAERDRMLQTAGQMADIYGQGLQRSLGWGALAPSIENLRYAGQDRAMAIGDLYQSQLQDQLNANIAQYERAQQAPWERLNAYSSQAFGVPWRSMAGTQDYRSYNPYTSAVMGALGGAVKGSELGPWGTAAGALGGGAGGFFGA